MKYYAMKIFTFILLLFLNGVACIGYAAPAIKENQVESGYLFIQLAKKAVITKTSSVGHYQLTLYHMDPWVVYFSDRPKQDRGMMPLDDFLVKMREQADQYKPKGLNAAIVSIIHPNKLTNTPIHAEKIIFTLTNPVYQSNYSMRYDAQIVPDQKRREVELFPKKTTLDRVVLFIDACIGCVGP